MKNNTNNREKTNKKVNGKPNKPEYKKPEPQYDEIQKMLAKSLLDTVKPFVDIITKGSDTDIKEMKNAGKNLFSLGGYKTSLNEFYGADLTIDGYPCIYNAFNVDRGVRFDKVTNNFISAHSAFTVIPTNIEGLEKPNETVNVVVDGNDCQAETEESSTPSVAPETSKTATLAAIGAPIYYITCSMNSKLDTYISVLPLSDKQYWNDRYTVSVKGESLISGDGIPCIDICMSSVPAKA